jgi:hypothetical protein
MNAGMTLTRKWLVGALMGLALGTFDASAQTATTRASRSASVAWTLWTQAVDPNTGQPLPDSAWESMGQVKATVRISEPSQGVPSLSASTTVVPGTNVAVVGTPTTSCNTYAPTSNGSGYYARCDITVTVEKLTSVGSYKTTNSWGVDGGIAGSGGIPLGVNVTGSVNGEMAGNTETTYQPKLRITRSWSVLVNLYNSCQTTPAYSLYVTGQSANGLYSSAPKRITSTCLNGSGNSAYCGKSTDRFTGNVFVSERGTLPFMYRTYRRPNGTTFEKVCILHSSSCHGYPNNASSEWLLVPFISKAFDSGWCNLGAEVYNYNHTTGQYDIVQPNTSWGGCSCDSIKWAP